MQHNAIPGDDGDGNVKRGWVKGEVRGTCEGFGNFEGVELSEGVGKICGGESELSIVPTGTEGNSNGINPRRVQNPDLGHVTIWVTGRIFVSLVSLPAEVTSESGPLDGSAILARR